MSEEMAAHKFAVGQKVRFSPDMGQVAARGETFTVVRYCPKLLACLSIKCRARWTVTPAWCGKANSPTFKPALPRAEVYPVYRNLRVTKRARRISFAA
jgi:hypothetical protein